MLRLFSAQLPIFARRVVFVPSDPMKNFLLYRFANNPRLQIAAGVQIFTLTSGMLELFSFGDKEHINRIPTFLELALHIECEIYAFLRDKDLAEHLLRFLEAAPKSLEKALLGRLPMNCWPFLWLRGILRCIYLGLIFCPSPICIFSGKESSINFLPVSFTGRTSVVTRSGFL